ncbi:MAG: response regulator [Bacteroidales bacterium]|nr:response regulator [Bacteroidales bacterium]
MTYGLMICDDLIFTSRVTATARAHGQTVKTARSPAVAERLLAEEMPSCVLIDLHTPELDLTAFLARLREHGQPAIRIVAYGSHVAKERLQTAREAGCDLVLPRSQFVQQLETELVGWLTVKGK